MKIPNTILAMLGGIGLTLFSLWFGQHNHLLPVPATADAALVDGLFNTMLTVSVGLFLLVQGLLIYAVIVFRQRPGDETDGPPIRGNIPLEVLWTSIPAAIVLAISIYSYEVYNAMGGLDPMAAGGTAIAHHHHHGGAAIAAPLDGMAPDMGNGRQVAYGVGADPDSMGKGPDVTIDVTGLQYAWLFNYANDGIMSGDLHVPVDQDVQLNIVAQDVLHAFWIPQFRLKQDAIPGQMTQLRFKPTVTGHYPIVCAELCGSYHGAMRAEVVVDSPEDYAAWKTSMVAAAGLDQSAIAAAIPTKQLSDADYLAPYGAELGIDPGAIAQLQP
ncbi:MAG: cytochrome c oxidase subunit II [Cyanobacteria bacterium]|nr:cytochrome c oxidase subunit II [Cyanobacteriota bacterium]